MNDITTELVDIEDNDEDVGYLGDHDGDDIKMGLVDETQCCFDATLRFCRLDQILKCYRKNGFIVIGKVSPELAAMCDDTGCPLIVSRLKSYIYVCLKV